VNSTVSLAANLFEELGDREKSALQILRRAYDVVPDVGGSYARSEAARHLGQIQQERGDPKGALKFLEESLQLLAEARLTRHLAFGLHAIGFARLEAGDLGGAEDYLRRAREMAERYGSRFILGLIGRTEADLTFRHLTSYKVHGRTHP